MQKKPSFDTGLQKNQIIELEITGMADQGMAIGKYEGQVVFVPLCAPGDLCRVKVLKALKRMAYGKLVELIRPAHSRIEPECHVFAQCGGCCFLHIDYQEELRIKERMVSDALCRIGGFSGLPIEPIIGADSRKAYRNKALFPIGEDPQGGVVLGFYSRNSHRLVACDSCLLQPEGFKAAMDAFREWAKKYGDSVYDERTHSGVMRWLYIREAAATGQMMICVVINGQRLRHERELVQVLRANVPGLASVIINSNRERTNVALGKSFRTIFGEDHIVDKLCGLEFEISPQSFYQVNRDGAQRLYGIAAQYADLKPGELLLDLYCGTGTVGLSVLNQGESGARLVGVEVTKSAVEDARRNAKRNGIENARFICGDAARAVAELESEGLHPDVVVLDPPRKGCAPQLIDTVARLAPRKIVYISCDPATLARDLKLFSMYSSQGFSPVRCRPVDMFPGTGHVETIVSIQRKTS